MLKAVKCTQCKRVYVYKDNLTSGCPTCGHAGFIVIYPDDPETAREPPTPVGLF